MITGFGDEERPDDALLASSGGRLTDTRSFALRHRTLPAHALTGQHTALDGIGLATLVTIVARLELRLRDALDQAVLAGAAAALGVELRRACACPHRSTRALWCPGTVVSHHGRRFYENTFQSPLRKIAKNEILNDVPLSRYPERLHPASMALQSCS
ncbi:MAG TPA: hypothetical protein VGD37_40685 [Kofleriaceae bacterium]